MHTTSVTLLQQLRRSPDEGTWNRFVELYTPMMFVWARQLGLQETDAADLVQDVFAILVRKMPEFEYQSHKSFRGWLRTVAHNQFRANWRRRRRMVPAEAAVDPEELAAPEDEAFWEVEYRRQLVSRALALMQADFEEKTWKACWECVVNDRKAPEVARELGLNPGAVRAAKFRVLARLRRELDGLLD